MEEYVIEKNISIPDRKNASPYKKIAKAMHVGDSVLFGTQTEANTLRSVLTRCGYKAVVRTLEDGYRVWRTA